MLIIDPRPAAIISRFFRTYHHSGHLPNSASYPMSTYILTTTSDFNARKPCIAAPKERTPPTVHPVLFIIQMRYLPRSFSSMPFPDFLSNPLMIRIPFFEACLKVVEGHRPLDSCAVVKYQHQVCRGSRGPQSEIELTLRMASTCLSRSRQCPLPIRIDPSQVYS